MSDHAEQRCVLLLGARGMLGQELARALGRRGAAPRGSRLVAWDLAELDITDRRAVQSAVQDLGPELVINAAAYTNVDGCESNLEQALQVNAEAPGHLAEACRAVDALLVHFSTDFVFDGSSNRPWREEDHPGPLSAYGRSKWEGEQVIRSAGSTHLIVRTSWLFGPGGRNFVEAILERAEKGEPLRVVNDQVGSPTLAVDLAEAVVRLINAGAAGAVHYCNAGHCSWYEFACAILSETGLKVPIEAITSDELNRPARRPAYSVLDTARYIETTGDDPPPWHDALKRYLAARGRNAAVA